MEIKGIRSVEIKKDETGEIKSVKMVFGPHYFVNIMPNEDGELSVYIGTSHHGFHVKSTEVGGELEKIICEVMKNHPDLSF